MGVAYTDVPRGAGIAYFPAVSLSYCESCQLNFGATPFLYPLVSIHTFKIAVAVWWFQNLCI